MTHRLPTCLIRHKTDGPSIYSLLEFIFRHPRPPCLSECTKERAFDRSQLLPQILHIKVFEREMVHDGNLLQKAEISR